MGKIAFIYAGQGAQCTGMGKEFYENCESFRNTFDESSRILGIDLKELCFQENEFLDRTDYTQMALVALCTAITKEVIKNGIYPDVTAGLSLGEYTAIYAAGGMHREDALKMIQKRGELMENAAPEGFGGMRAVLGMKGVEVEKILSDIEDVSVANFNAPGQVVITGRLEALDKAEKELKSAGARRITPLKISGPFHSPFMRETGEKLNQHLEQVNWNELAVPYVANVNAEIVTDINLTPELLKEQVSSNVLWEPSVLKMAEYGVDRFIEIGPNKCAGKLVQRILPQAKVYSISTPDELDACQEWLKEA